MNKEELSDWKEAGRIASRAIEYGRKLTVKGALLCEVCDAVDEKIISMGAKPAWPTQAGLNDVAAHATPSAEDKTALDGQVICLDVGAHVNNCVGDTALTVDLSGNWKELVKASEDALEAAIKVANAGVELREIGMAIQEKIESRGFRVVRNLSGHTITKEEIHASPTIPNFDNGSTKTLEEGQIIAIEPFATNGAGMIHEKGPAEIFSILQKKPVRNPFAKKVLDYCAKEYSHFPFAKRWISSKFGEVQTRIALNELERAGLLHNYPPLVERANGIVAVAERTLLVGKKSEILTDWE